MVNIVLIRPSSGEAPVVSLHKQALYAFISESVSALCVQTIASSDAFFLFSAEPKFIDAGYPDTIKLWRNLWRAYDPYNGLGYRAKFDQVDRYWLRRILKAHGFTREAHSRISDETHQPCLPVVPGMDTYSLVNTLGSFT